MLNTEGTEDYKDHNVRSIINNPLVKQIKKRILDEFSKKYGLITREDLSSLLDKEIYRIAKQYWSNNPTLFLERLEAALWQLAQNEARKEYNYRTVKVIEVPYKQFFNERVEEKGYHRIEFWESVKSYLTDEEFDLIYKIYVLGYQQKEIAEQEGVRPQTISHRVRTILRKLADATELLDDS